MSELQRSKEQKIAIIGAGISGLTAAHTLKKLGYNNITVFEANDRVGGKVHTVEIDGYIYELGAIFLQEKYKTLRNLAKEYNVKLKKEANNTFLYSNSKRLTASKFMQNKYNIFDIIKASTNLIKLLLKYRWQNTIGFMNTKKEFFPNLKKFAIENKIEVIADLLEPMMPAFGYGFINETPAAYYIKILNDSLKFVIKQELNNLFGLNMTTMLLFDKGFQNLLEKMAGNFDVRLDSKVTKIERKQNKDSCKINITANNKTQNFDRMIISSVPVQTMRFLDMTAEEETVFSKAKNLLFHVILFYGEGLPIDKNAWFFDNRNMPDPKGYPACIGNLNPEHNIFIINQLHNGEFTDNELEEKLVEFVNNIGGKVNGIIISDTYEYFPFYSEEDLNESQPFKRLEEMQGKKGTYFIGGLFNFESTEDTANYAQYLVNKHFH